MENPFELIIERLNAIERLLYQLKERQTNMNGPVKDENEWMNVKQIAEYLSLTVPTIYSKISRRELPYYKRGRRAYFKKKDIDDWILQARRKTVAEIEQEAIDTFKSMKRKK